MTSHKILSVFLAFVCVAAALAPHRRDVTHDGTARIEGYRLPRHLLPDHYEVRLLPFLTEGNFTIDGFTKITFTCYEASNNITVHYKDMVSVSVLEVAGAAGKVFAVTAESYEEQRNQYVITVDGDFTVGQQYTISFGFVAKLTDLMVGFYRSSYTNAAGERKWHAVTQFESTDARRAFPCFDEPDMKAKFTVTLGRTSDYSSVANARILQAGVPHDFDPNFVWDIYEETPVVMSTYLVAFAVTDFVEFVGRPTASGTPVSTWANPTFVAEQAALSLEITPTIMEFMEDYTGIPYAMPKMDQMAVPDFSAGAMENWGLIKYRNNYLMWNGPLKQTASDEQYVVEFVAHELAHQWFGNLVTCEWWSVLWLNEGFSTYFESLGAQAAKPDWQEEHLFVVEKRQYVMGGPDALNSTRPLYVPVENNAEADLVFDSIAYEKGGSVIRMVADFLSQGNAFQKAIRRYLSDRQFQNAAMTDLFAAWQTEAEIAGIDLGGVDVLAIMDSWTLQKNYPIITITRQFGSGSATVSQARFIRNANIRAAEKEGVYWWVPLTYSQDFTNVVRAWLPNTAEPLSIQGLDDTKPVIFNLKANGYYRVNYDSMAWAQINSVLDTLPSSIDVITRAQLIDDAMDFAQAGYLPYSVAFPLTRHLATENEWLPWDTFDNNIQFVDNLLAGSLAYPDFRTYFLRLLRNFYNNVGFQESPTDNIMTLFKRNIATRWACKFGFADCVENSNNVYSQWAENQGGDLSFISPNQKSTVLCTAIRNGGLEEFSFAVEEYMNEFADKKAIMSALTCSTDIVLLNKLLEWSVTDGSPIPKGYASDVYSNMAKNPVGRGSAFVFVMNNWDLIASRFGTPAVGASWISQVSRYFSKESEVAELTAFRDSHLDNLTVIFTLTQAVENAESNLEWMNTHYSDVATWLENEVIGGKNL